MSAFHRLSPGDWITFEDEAQQVTGFSDTCVRLRSSTGRGQLILTAELLSDPGFAPRPPGDGPPPQPVAAVDALAVLDDLPQQEAQRVLDLEAHLLEVVSGYRSGDAGTAEPGEPRPQYDPALPVEQRVKAKADELGRTPRAVFQQLRKWREEGVRALVDKRKVRPSNPLAGVDPRIIDAIRQQAAYEVEDSTGGLPRFRRRVQKRLDEQHGPGAVALPSKDTFRRHVALLTNGRYTFGPSSTRRTNAGQPDRMFGHVIAMRPGELVMLDTTRLDVIAYDPLTDATVPVELTVCLDLFSRSILSWRMTPEGTKGIEIGMLVADAMMPEPMRPAWTESLRFSMDKIPYKRLAEFDERLALAAARPVIYPESLMIDHGKPYESDVLRRACRKLGINILPSREGKPTDKPEVEAAFDTIREQFSEHVAGYKGSSVAQRGRDVEASARWTISELEEFFAEYVVTVYQRRRHGGLTVPGHPKQHLSPNEAYAMGVEMAGYVTCPSDPDLYYELLPIIWRQIRPGGVQSDYLFYDDPVIYKHRNEKSHYKNPRYPKLSGLWPIRIDPRNLLHAYFYDELGDQKWHVLTWTHALETHRPFTDVMLREVKRLLAERGKRPDEEAEIAATLEALQNRTDSPQSWSTSDRRRATKEAERARAVARDQRRAAAAAEPAIALYAVPDLADESQDDPEEITVDLSDLTAAEIWSPRASKAAR